MFCVTEDTHYADGTRSADKGYVRGIVDCSCSGLSVTVTRTGSGFASHERSSYLRSLQ